jgi:opacity protein-like surface antigen
MKRSLAKFLCTTALAFSPIISQDVEAQNDSTKRKFCEYWQLGTTLRTFNNYQIQKVFEAPIVGFEFGFGSKLTPNIKFENYNGWISKSKDKKKISIFESGIFIDLLANNGFYIGSGMKLASVSAKNGNEKESKMGFGFGGRIGIEAELSPKTKLDLEYSYSVISMSGTDVGTNGISAKIKF